MFLRDTPSRTAMHKENFISVAVASNDRFDLLHRVLDAVHKHADMPFEIVVADDAGHRHGDLSVFQQFRDKVSRLAVNCGDNMGLAVNANQAIAATRGRNVVFLSDDSLVLRPFMREVFTALDEAPYVGVLYLGQTYSPDAAFVEVARRDGFVRARTRSGSRLALHCMHGSSWACAFRRDYWTEVGGYSEDDVYGDLPFINKGWARGYFSAGIAGPQIAYDIDVAELGKTRGSIGHARHGSHTHYPRLFSVPLDRQAVMAQERVNECSARNHLGRAERFNEFDCVDWSAYMREVTASGRVDWSRLTRHGRFRVELEPDLENP
jgi:hypothetical protein